jgi:hypothetical protein
MFERPKTVRALDRAAIETGQPNIRASQYHTHSPFSVIGHFLYFFKKNTASDTINISTSGMLM